MAAYRISHPDLQDVLLEVVVLSRAESCRILTKVSLKIQKNYTVCYYVASFVNLLHRGI